MKEMRKNLKIIVLCFAVIIIVLVCRLMYIQIWGNKELSEVTHVQSLISLNGSNTRGDIYDRNGAYLVAEEKRYIYMIPEEKNTEKVRMILKSLGAKQVTGKMQKRYAVFSSTNYDKKKGKKIIAEYGGYIIEASARYSDHQTAAHFIGYVNKMDSSGAAGIELMCNEQLSSLNRKIYAVADVNGNIIPGRGLIVTTDSEKDSSVKDGIRTTIDKNMQQAIEKIIEPIGQNCAVVVLESDSGGIVAMASTPAFNPNNADKYVKNRGNQLINRATQGKYPPGSLYKIITAATALESGADMSKTYECLKNVSVGNITIKCDTGGETGHGEINMTDAFAKSCNSYFIQLGTELGEDRIIEMAKKFHLGEKSISGYPQESKGHVMTAGEGAGAGVANMSIGQGETLVTPVQMARVVNVIAKNGVDKGIHILMDEDIIEERIISEKTAKKISMMMQAVVIKGTAKSYKMFDENGNPETAVKTGTAEYGTDQLQVHSWMAGYIPCEEEPEYTICVLVEGNGIQSNKAGVIYKKIIDYIEKSGNYSKPTLA